MDKYNLPYHVVRSRRKTVAIQIGPDGTVTVRCPVHFSAEAVSRFVQSKASWIEKQLMKQSQQPRLPVFTEEQLSELAQQAKHMLSERVAYFASRVGVTYGRVTVRKQRSRWGSCSGKGNLNFNCLLMLAPPEVMDYVIVHELCHRKQLNHGKAFWAEVERVLPDYKLRKKWLKENGAALIARLPGK